MTGTGTLSTSERPAISAHEMHPLRAMLKKTFAETMYVMIGAWAVVLLAVIEEWYTATDGFSRPAKLHNVLVAPGPMGLAAFGCAAVGFVLGAVQFWSLSRFEQWALLVHRPLSRTRLFGYGSLAGLALYGVTVGVPLVIFLVWGVSNLGATVPFFWGYLGPYVAAVATGVPCYFVGVVVMMRRARWYGTRFVPLSAGVLLLALSFVLRYLTAVLVVDVLAAGVIGLVAWGALVAQGRMRRAPWAGRAGLIGTLVLGCVLPAFAIWMTGEFALRDYAYGLLPPVTRGRNPTYARLAILSDGKIAVHVFHYRYDAKGSIDEQTDEFRSRSDEPMEVGLAIRNLMLMSDLLSTFFGSTNEAALPTKYSFRVDDSIESEEPTSPPRAQAPLPTGVPLESGERILQASVLAVHRDVPGAETAPHWWAVLTNKQVYVWDGARVIVRVPVTHAFPEYRFYLAVSADLKFVSVQYYLSELVDSPTYFWQRLKGRPELAYYRRFYEVYDLTGKLVDSAANPQGDPVVDKYNDNAVVREVQREARLGQYSFPAGLLHGTGMSLAALPLQRWTTLSTLDEETQFFYWEPMAFAGTATVNVLAALGLIVLAAWYGLRLRAMAGWVVAGLVGGPLMLVVFAGFHERPVRVRCDRCGRKRRVDAVACAHCGEAFAKPAANGTEILGGETGGVAMADLPVLHPSEG